MDRLVFEIKNIIVNHKAKVANHSQTVRSVVAIFGGNMTSSVLGAIGALIVARFLGPNETGLFRAFTIPLMYLTFLHMGTFDGLHRQIPYYIGKRMPEKVESLASSAGAWNFVVSSIVSIGFVIYSIYSFWHHDFYGMVGWLSQALCCWGVLYSGYLSATYRTINQFVALGRIQMVQAILNFGMIVIVPYLKFYGLCVRSAFSAIAGVWLFHRNRPLKIDYYFDTKALGELFKIGIPFSFWGSLYTSVWTATESTLMLSLGGVTGLGLFSVATVIREGMNIIPLSVYQVLTPRVVEAFAREGSIRNANARSMWLAAGLTVLMALAIIVVSLLLDVLVPLAVPKYVEGIPLIKVCLWFALIQAASLPLNTLFATGSSWLYGRGVIFGLAVFPLTAYLLTPTLGGILAVAWGSLLGRTARTIVAYLEIIILTRREAL